MIRRTLVTWMLLGLLVLGALPLLACHTSMRDTSTVHNREATRIWVVRRNESGTTHDQVIFCDIELARAGRELCIAWGTP